MSTPLLNQQALTPRWGLKGLIGLACLLCLGLAWELDLFQPPLHRPWSLVFLGLTLGVFGLRVGLWLRYRPIPAPVSETLPTLTVVVPAYNEGPGVMLTLRSLLASDYPHHLLRVIAVNDGSRDDTGAALDAALAEAKAQGDDRLQVIHLPHNQGKRHALYAGFCAAQSELVATVDSDSIVTPDTLRCLVAPFMDAHTGAVAGKVLVLNRDTNVLTRMLHVRYVLGFDFVRAFQSQLRTVWCCPGALQCYRLTLIRPHLDGWLHQRFLGARCKNGDDHAMTNLVLSLGFDARYQRNAEVFTIVPDTYRKLCRMYVRWARSATREGLLALAFTPARFAQLLKRASLGTAFAMALDAVVQPLTIALRILAVLGGAWFAFINPPLLLKSLVGATLVSLPYGAIYLRSERSSDALFGVLYGWFATLALFWIQPFASLSVRKNGWMTRG